jgi:nucleotide-binding universal stress UspA family protein
MPSTEHRAARPVVAYLDGSESSIAAALWAQDEATARGTRVKLLAIVDPSRAAGDAESAASHALWAAATAVGASGRLVEVECATARGDVEAVLRDESCRAAMLCLAAGPVAARVASSALSPVILVRQHHSPAAHPTDRWVVAVMEHGASAVDVLRTAVAEARLRRAAVMALTPADCDPERYLAGLGEPLDGTSDVEIWALPQPRDVLALLLQSSDLEHLVVAAADCHALVSAFTDESAAPPLPDHFSLLVVPGGTEVAARRNGRSRAPQGWNSDVARERHPKTGPTALMRLSQRS